MATHQEADMDGSVSAACSAASEAVARTLLAVNRFVREVRESRSEFDGITTELHSLDGVLDLLGYDAAFIPPLLAEHTPAVLETCLALLNELEGCISLLNRPDLPRPEKRSRWLASRKHVDTLRWTLSEYKLVLGLAADLVGVTKSRAADAADRGTPDDKQARGGGRAEDNGLAIVTARIIEVANELKDDLEQSVAMARLGHYLDMLRAETGVEPRSPVPAQRDERRPHRTSSMGGPPDSAIDVSYDDVVLESVWEHPQHDASPTGAPAGVPAGAGSETPPSGRQSSLFRRRSSKLSTTFRVFGRKRSSSSKGDAPDVGDDAAAQVPNAVFGVPLANSIQVARGVAGTRHGTGGSSSHATRDYPLCVLRCVYHIRDCGLHVPHVFGGLEDQDRVAELKAVFSSPETSYGKELDWSQFTVHEAAALILVFLSELPRPLISESVAKRWVSLSRQAAVGGVRLDQGIDFWEEALLGVQGHARALFKLLLNLWGDLADAAPVNEMTAERLAARVIRPLMHAIPAHHHTDFMLGLAFLIRKRSEYNLAANGVARKSNAAF
ncbi:uncharacterized protein P884DRAFT_209541 [Thermothelomyces heterothallicus CBS 202.75]|uniref:uncharacterized protein n=1 Tax=Thermothelomyces heterothallicus CBS 202.75 TaxID=1149848 RepID=UPI00374414AF